MKCSVFLAQIRGEEGLAAPCPRQRCLTVPFGDEGSCHLSTRWQGAKELPASNAGSAERAGHPPSAMGAVSHLEERIPPLLLQGCFAYAPLGKEEFYCGCTERAKSRGCFMARGSQRGEAGVPDAAYSKAWQRRRALLQSRAGLRERAEVIFLLRAGGSGEEI